MVKNLGQLTSNFGGCTVVVEKQKIHVTSPPEIKSKSPMKHEQKLKLLNGDMDTLQK